MPLDSPIPVFSALSAPLREHCFVLFSPGQPNLDYPGLPWILRSPAPRIGRIRSDSLGLTRISLESARSAGQPPNRKFSRRVAEFAEKKKEGTSFRFRQEFWPLCRWTLQSRSSLRSLRHCGSTVLFCSLPGSPTWITLDYPGLTWSLGAPAPKSTRIRLDSVGLTRIGCDRILSPLHACPP